MEQERIYEAIKNHIKKNTLEGAEVILEKEQCKVLIKKLCDNVTRKITYKILLDDGSEVIDCGNVTRRSLIDANSKVKLFRLLYDYDSNIEERDLKYIAEKLLSIDNELEKIEVTTKISEQEVIYKIYSAVEEQVRSFEKGYCPILIKDFKDIVSNNIEEYDYDDVKRILKKYNLLKTGKDRAFDDNERMLIEVSNQEYIKKPQRVIKLKAIA